MPFVDTFITERFDVVIKICIKGCFLWTDFMIWFIPHFKITSIKLNFLSDTDVNLICLVEL